MARWLKNFLPETFAFSRLNPKQLDRFRDRYFPAGVKDDRKDALVLADSLRTDQHCFRSVRMNDPVLIREFSRLAGC
jgi:transposase